MSTNDLAIYQPDAQVGELKLWRPPEEVMVEAQQAAQVLQKRIAGKKKPVIFNGEQYIESDDWQMLANFFGYSAKIESTEFVEFGEIRGFKACAVLLHEHTGMVVGRAESMCLDEEENWGLRAKYEWQTVKGSRQKVQVGTVNTPLFQLMSMAQTRACAKACRNKLAWVVSLAGYKPTVSEELNENTLPPETPQPAPLPAEIKKKEPQSVQAAPPSSAATIRPPAAVAPPPTNAAPNLPARTQSAPPAERPKQPITPQHPAKSQPRMASEAQGRRFFAKWKSAGKSKDMVDDYLRSIGAADEYHIPLENYESACAWADGDF